MALAVELGKPSHQHGADGHVNAHPQGIGAANDLKQAFLCQALYQTAVFGEHARVVDTDALAQELGQILAKGSGEAETTDFLGNRFLFFLGDDPRKRGKRLGALGRFALREVHHVDGSLLIGQELLDGLVHRAKDIGKVQRDGTRGAGDEVGGAAGAAGEILF